MTIIEQLAIKAKSELSDKAMLFSDSFGEVHEFRLITLERFNYFMEHADPFTGALIQQQALTLRLALLQTVHKC